MAPLSITSGALALTGPVLYLVKALYGTFTANTFLLRHYGLVGPYLVVFGSKDVLRSELQVLAGDGEHVASEFKKATQDESSMIAVAVRRDHIFDIKLS